MKKRRVRFALDAVLTALIIIEMFVQYTGVFAHEIIGFVFLACVAVHIAFSFSWLKKTTFAIGERRNSTKRIWLLIIALLLAGAAFPLAVSSIVISDTLRAIGLTSMVSNYGTWVTIHTIASYALCILVVVHLAMHWTMLAHALRVPYNPQRRAAIGTGVNMVATLGAVAIGLSAARSLGVFDAAEPERANADAGVDDETIVSEASDVGTTTAQSSASAQESASSNKTAQQSSSAASTSSISSTTGSSTTVTGNCTLCHKNCPLSAPQCNRPYEVGLIA